MRIETYFQQMHEAIDICPAVQAFNVTDLRSLTRKVAYDKRSTHEGFIRGEVSSSMK